MSGECGGPILNECGCDQCVAMKNARTETVALGAEATVLGHSARPKPWDVTVWALAEAKKNAVEDCLVEAGREGAKTHVQISDAGDKNPRHPTQILDEARHVVYGRGEREYGHPRDDFGRTAAMITALFAHKLKPGERFEAVDWAKMMILAKLSRSMTKEQPDNYIDQAGYAETAARVLWDPE